jgi:hypothetical protein
MDTVKLIPVDQWIYDLYKVTYWSGDPDVAGSRVIKSIHLASSCENHLSSDANENAPGECWMSWEIVKHNVGRPRVVGQMYGQSVYESSRSHGQRLAQQM